MATAELGSPGSATDRLKSDPGQLVLGNWRLTYEYLSLWRKHLGWNRLLEQAFFRSGGHGGLVPLVPLNLYLIFSFVLRPWPFSLETLCSTVSVCLFPQLQIFFFASSATSCSCLFYSNASNMNFCTRIEGLGLFLSLSLVLCPWFFGSNINCSGDVHIRLFLSNILTVGVTI